MSLRLVAKTVFSFLTEGILTNLAYLKMVTDHYGLGVRCMFMREVLHSLYNDCQYHNDSKVKDKMI